MSGSMKAWRVHAWGEPETMSLDEIPVPEPAQGQVRIRTFAAGLNFFDILQVQGKYQIKPPFPFTPGAEVAGVVDAAGPAVTGLDRGDRVVAMTHGGGFAEYSLAAAQSVFPLPTNAEGRTMDWPGAAAMPIVFHTSYFTFTQRVPLRAGDWLLVHAGASGVGVSAIQLGRTFGARVIATAGSPEKLDYARQQGAEFALDYNDATWVEQVKQITGGSGADVIYDPVGGDVFDLSTKCIAPGGKLIVVGFASGRIPSIAANRILLKNMSVVGALWGGYVQAHPEYPAQAQQALAILYRNGQIHPPHPQTFPFAQTREALRSLASRTVLGKAAIVMNTL